MTDVRDELTDDQRRLFDGILDGTVSPLDVPDDLADLPIPALEILRDSIDEKRGAAHELLAAAGRKLFAAYTANHGPGAEFGFTDGGNRYPRREENE